MYAHAHQDERGYGFIGQPDRPEEPSPWVTELFLHKLFRGGAGQLQVRLQKSDGEGKTMGLNECAGRRQPDIALPMRIGAGKVDLRVSLFSLPQDLAWLFWLLPTMFVHIGMEAQGGAKLGSGAMHHGHVGNTCALGSGLRSLTCEKLCSMTRRTRRSPQARRKPRGSSPRDAPEYAC